MCRSSVNSFELILLALWISVWWNRSVHNKNSAIHHHHHHKRDEQTEMESERTRKGVERKALSNPTKQKILKERERKWNAEHKGMLMDLNKYSTYYRMDCWSPHYCTTQHLVFLGNLLVLSVFLCLFFKWQSSKKKQKNSSAFENFLFVHKTSS